MDDLLMRAISWRNGNQTGVSSVALVSRLMGWPNPGRRSGDDRRHPDDAHAFARCHLALQALPELRARLDDARDLSLFWDRLIDRWADLETAYEHEQATDSAPKLEALMQSIFDLLCPACLNGELEWNDEFSAVCKACGDARQRRDPRLPAPEPQPSTAATASIRANLVAGYLLIGDDGQVIGENDDCGECEGEGRVECVCGSCENEHTAECEECGGTGSVAVTWDFEHEPTVNEGETAIVAIFDKRRLHGPRIGCETKAQAQHTLDILLEQSDETLTRLFTERVAA